MDNDWLYTRDDWGESPLTRVSRSGRMEVTNILFFQTLEDTLKTVAQLPPMHRAAYWGYADAIEELAAAGAEIDETDAQGETPLHKAVRLGNLEAACALLDRDASVDMQNAIGLAPLHWAALTGRADLAELLLERGANPFLRDWVTGGMTALDFARMMRYDDVAELLEESMGLVIGQTAKKRACG